MRSPESREGRRVLLVAGAAHFDAAAFFEAHEAWEEVWRTLEASPTREWVQGLVQIAAGFHKLHAQNKPTEAARILARGVAHLVAASASDPTLALGAWPALVDSVRQRIVAQPSTRPNAPVLTAFLDRSEGSVGH